MRISVCVIVVFVSGLLSGLTSVALAESARVAVAANFADPARDIAAAFLRETGHEAQLSFGATGQFYTQITQEAPFEVFLAADDQRPAQAVRDGYGMEGTVFTYALGRLVLYAEQGDTPVGPETLKSERHQWIAIANPELAPYGAAAVQVMQALDIYDSLQGKLVRGQNVGQAYQFVRTGNAGAGFVALGQVMQANKHHVWIVPQDLYTPIRQDAVLLEKGKSNPAAIAFLEFLQSDVATEIIRKYGYALEH